MIIREKYMMLSQQGFPFTTAKYLNKVFMDDQKLSDRRNSFFNPTGVSEKSHDEADDGKTRSISLCSSFVYSSIYLSTTVSLSISALSLSFILV